LPADFGVFINQAMTETDKEIILVKPNIVRTSMGVTCIAFSLWCSKWAILNPLRRTLVIIGSAFLYRFYKCPACRKLEVCFFMLGAPIEACEKCHKMIKRVWI